MRSIAWIEGFVNRVNEIFYNRGRLLREVGFVFVHHCEDIFGDETLAVVVGVNHLFETLYVGCEDLVELGDCGGTFA